MKAKHRCWTKPRALCGLPKDLQGRPDAREWLHAQLLTTKTLLEIKRELLAMFGVRAEVYTLSYYLKRHLAEIKATATAPSEAAAMANKPVEIQPPAKGARQRKHPLRSFLIYTAEGMQAVEANSLARAVSLCGIVESENPILAAFDSACVPQYAAPTSPIVAVLLRNPSTEGRE